jgi:hypothetical protein
MAFAKELKMNNYSKKTKKEIRQLAGLAHERELEKALSDLNLKFKLWENKEQQLFLNKRSFLNNVRFNR